MGEWTGVTPQRFMHELFKEIKIDQRKDESKRENRRKTHGGKDGGETEMDDLWKEARQ